jgi:hypothetical protein
MDGGDLRVTITNDGPPLPRPFDVASAAGYGLRNVQERLRARSPSGRLDIRDAEYGVAATLVMPSWEGAAPPARL